MFLDNEYPVDSWSSPDLPDSRVARPSSVRESVYDGSCDSLSWHIMHKESGGLDRMLKWCLSVSMILVISAKLGKEDGATSVLAGIFTNDICH